MATVKPKPPAYYNDLYRRGGDLSREWEAELDAAVAPHIIGKYVIDLGCGTGHIVAKLLEKADIPFYFGIDFSPVAIEKAQSCWPIDEVRFMCDDLRNIPSGEWGSYDTAILMEVLEHVDFVDQLVETARQLCRNRIIATVPVNLPGRAHVKPRWTEAELRRLFGFASKLELSQFGGPEGNRWWLIVADK